MPMEAKLDYLTETAPGFNEPWTPQQQMQELKTRLGFAQSIIDSQEMPALKLNPDDVLVTVPPKNGMTWLLHVCHQIRMKGQEPNFEDQWEVVCLIEGHEKLYGQRPND